MSYLLFIVSSFAALNFSYTQISEVIGKLILLTDRIESKNNDLQFDCRDEQCHRCAVGINDTPKALLFTGGSSFRYGVDMDVFSKSFDSPIVNCIKNDTRVDAYTIFFNHINIKSSGQIVLHGYNSWAVNSPGTWVQENSDGLKSWFNIREKEPQRNSESPHQNNEVQARNMLSLYEAYSTYLPIFLTRLSAERPNYWRIVLSAKYSAHKNNDASYWPLTREEHKKKKYKLMQQWIYRSPWAKSFMIDMKNLQPKEKIIYRHEAFVSSLTPRKHIFLFPAPELSEIFPSDIKSIIKSSKDILLEYIDEQSIMTHVEIDYEACGITADDFWFDSIKIYDPAHPNETAKTKITNCMINALATRVNEIEKNRP